MKKSVAAVQQNISTRCTIYILAEIIQKQQLKHIRIYYCGVHVIGLNVKYVPKQVVQQPMVGQLAVNFPLFMQPESALLFTSTDTELCAEPHVFSPHHILYFVKIPFCYKPRDKDILL